MNATQTMATTLIGAAQRPRLHGALAGVRVALARQVALVLRDLLGASRARHHIKR